jgi:hypothetical protein
MSILLPTAGYIVETALGIKERLQIWHKTCKKIDFLKPAHGGANIKNLNKILKIGTKAFTTHERQWYSTIKNRKSGPEEI